MTTKRVTLKAKKLSDAQADQIFTRILTDQPVTHGELGHFAIHCGRDKAFGKKVLRAEFMKCMLSNPDTFKSTDTRTMLSRYIVSEFMGPKKGFQHSLSEFMRSMQQLAFSQDEEQEKMEHSRIVTVQIPDNGRD